LWKQWPMRYAKKKNSCEIYPDSDKEDKQFKYAKRKNIPYIVTLNIDRQNFKIKNIKTGESQITSNDDLLKFDFN
jgi:histidyl-tRNA synthetase